MKISYDKESLKPVKRANPVQRKSLQSINCFSNKERIIINMNKYNWDLI